MDKVVYLLLILIGLVLSKSTVVAKDTAHEKSTSDNDVTAITNQQQTGRLYSISSGKENIKNKTAVE